MTVRHRLGLLRSSVGAAVAAGLVLAPVSSAVAQNGPGLSLIRDTEIEAILHQDADPIFVAAGLNPKSVQIHILGDRQLNAFSAGGEQLFLNTGLILEAKTPNQLVGVIAHETGHVAGGHIARSGAAGRAALGPMILSVGLGVLAALAGAPDAAAGLVFSAGYFGQISVLGYSREQESRADQAAVTYLEGAGTSGRGLVEFFNNFRYQEVFDDEKKYPFFRDHPLTDDRIEALAARVEHQPHADVVDTAESIERHALMHAKLEGFIGSPGQTLADYPETDKTFAARYARAIAYYKATDTDHALKAIGDLLAEQPNNPYLWELKGQVLFEIGRAKDAEPAHRRSVELMPDAPLLRSNLAQALIAVGGPAKLDEAVRHLQRSLQQEPDSPLGWRLLAEAYDGQNKPGPARLAAAEQNFYLGQLLEARTFAFNARKLLVKGTPEWRRATDIILASKPTPGELKDLGGV